MPERPGGMSSPRRKFHIISAVLFIWTLLVVARLIYLQVIQYDSLTRQARRQQERTIEVSPVRGVIYDRNMRPLAMSVEVDSIFAVPSEVEDVKATAKALAPLLRMQEDGLRGKLQGRRFFSWVKRKVSGREAAQVRQLKLPGIYFQKEHKRFYPDRELAAHVLGYVGLDDHGLAGVEYAYEKSIRGKPGQMVIATDAKQKWLGRDGHPPVPGENLVLTLDESMQYVAERELASAMTEFRAASASVVVQDPNTGEILAIASQPTYNPNAYSEAAPDALRNLAVSASYEPGSTFKVITLSAALEEKLTTPDERIDCQMGSITLAGHVIHDHKAYGLLTTSEILQNSSGVGAIKLALRLGNDAMYRHLRAFGFGSPTDIELPGEADGLIKPPERWSKISIGAIAMGHEIGVTPLQLVTAISAVANGGRLLRPRIVREGLATDQPGQAAGMPGKRIISEETASAMQRMMKMVVTNGTAKSARLDGYTAAGKTGTSQKIDPVTRRYSHRDFVASFVGFAPAESPLFTILVVVDTPRGKIYGGEVAGPVFKRIAEQLLAIRNVPPALPETPRLAQAVWTEPDIPPVDLPPPSFGDAEQPADPQATILLSLDSRLTVPDFVGQGVRTVAERSQSNGLEVQMIGSGVSYRQSPAAGSPLVEGQKVQVWFRVGRMVQAPALERQSSPRTPSEGGPGNGSGNSSAPARRPAEGYSQQTPSQHPPARSSSSGTSLQQG